MHRFAHILAFGLALSACDARAPADASSQQQAKQAVSKQSRIGGLVIRLPAKGGEPATYRLPDLAPVPNLLRGRLPPVERIVGLDPETEFLYVLTPKHDVLAFDLESGRTDSVASGVVLATVGPDGTLYGVDDQKRVTTVARRVRFVWPAALGDVPTDLFGAGNERLVAVVRQEGMRIIAAAATQAPVIRELRQGGDVAASSWGDMLAVATDSGVVLLDPLGRRDEALVRLTDHPRAVAFSPSGHRVYVARRTLPGLAVIDRFELEELDGVALPGPAATIRLDPLGRWLIARPAAGDSAWIVDLPVKRLVGAVATTWQGDLPVVAADGSVVVRQGHDVVVYHADSTGALRATGRHAGGADDLWLVTRWRPRWGLATEAGVAADSAAPGGGELLYVQVSVSRNRAWSDEMAQQLTRAGLTARVLAPSRPEEGYRVVLGPYPTRAEAETIGRKLGRPYWIYQPEP